MLINKDLMDSEVKSSAKAVLTPSCTTIFRNFLYPWNLQSIEKPNFFCFHNSMGSSCPSFPRSNSVVNHYNYSPLPLSLHPTCLENHIIVTYHLYFFWTSISAAFWNAGKYASNSKSGTWSVSYVSRHLDYIFYSSNFPTTLDNYSTLSLSSNDQCYLLCPLSKLITLLLSRKV